MYRASALCFAALAACASTQAGSVAPLTTPAEGLYQTLSSTSRAAVDRAPITPLFFGTASTAEGAVVTAGPHFYAVSLHRDGHSLALHGVDQVHADRGARRAR